MVSIEVTENANTYPGDLRECCESTLVQLGYAIKKIGRDETLLTKTQKFKIKAGRNISADCELTVEHYQPANSENSYLKVIVKSPNRISASNAAEEFLNKLKSYEYAYS